MPLPQREKLALLNLYDLDHLTGLSQQEAAQRLVQEPCQKGEERHDGLATFAQS